MLIAMLARHLHKVLFGVLTLPVLLLFFSYRMYIDEFLKRKRVVNS